MPEFWIVVKFRNDKARIMVKWGKILCEMSLKRRGTIKRMRRRRRALLASGISPSLNCFTTPESVIAL